MKRCITCLNAETRPRIEFNEYGICKSIVPLPKPGIYKTTNDYLYGTTDTIIVDGEEIECVNENNETNLLCGGMEQYYSNINYCTSLSSAACLTKSSCKWVDEGIKLNQLINDDENSNHICLTRFSQDIITDYTETNKIRPFNPGGKLKPNKNVCLMCSGPDSNQCPDGYHCKEGNSSCTCSTEYPLEIYLSYLYHSLYHDSAPHWWSPS